MRTLRTRSTGAAMPAPTLILCLATLLCLASAATATEHVVTVSGSGFDPEDITIQGGDTITWTNDGGTHNVLADDASFTSGPPSSDAWEFSHILNEGGVYGYHCEQHPLAETGTITVEGIFGDRFEAGTHQAWDQAVVFEVPNCSCYFSGDCAGSTFCDWGVLTNEDICFWRENKPDGVPGAGCDVAYDGPWIGGICDGICAASSSGSILGNEDVALIEEATRLWAAAILQPAAAGGGPIDPHLAKAAQELGFQQPNAGMAAGRQVADLLATVGVPEFAEHFCFFEGHPGDQNSDLWVDLSDDPCRLSAAWTAVEALLAELNEPGSCSEIVGEIEAFCPDWREMFGPRCTGDDALTCIEERIADLATFLVTPKVYRGTVPDLFRDPLADWR